MIYDKSPVVLAQVDVEHAWEIFRYLPIGGWNECPPPEEIAAFCRKLYESFGAVPVSITGATLELIPARRPDKREAYQLALEMYAFCPDIVDQSGQSIYALADGLTKSDVWFFWWD